MTMGRKPSRMDIIGQNGNDGDHYKYERKHEEGAENYNIKEQEKKDRDGNRLPDVHSDK